MTHTTQTATRSRLAPTVTRVALQVVAERKAIVQEYEDEVERWYRSGDGRPQQWVDTEHGPVNLGGRGYRFPYCIHGSSLWTDYDNICGGCEAYGNTVPVYEGAVDEALWRLDSQKRYSLTVYLDPWTADQEAPCQRGTVGCSVDHGATALARADGSPGDCDTW